MQTDTRPILRRTRTARVRGYTDLLQASLCGPAALQNRTTQIRDCADLRNVQICEVIRRLNLHRTSGLQNFTGTCRAASCVSATPCQGTQVCKAMELSRSKLSELQGRCEDPFCHTKPAVDLSIIAGCLYAYHCCNIAEEVGKPLSSCNQVSSSTSLPHCSSHVLSTARVTILLQKVQ